MKYRAIIIMLVLLCSANLFSLQTLQSPDKSELIIKAQDFVNLLAEGEFEKAVADFDATMTKLMPAAKIKEIWEQVARQVGEYIEQVAVRTETAGIYEIVLITCSFIKAKLDVKVVFNPQNQITGLFFVPPQPKAKYAAPEYADPSTYTEEDVEFGLDAWRLPATLTRPTGKGPFPALVLVHGSGPNNRDESIGPNKPFKDLALGLASRGIAVLRYEKRTKAYNPKFLDPNGRFTIKEETVEDAVLAAEYLMARAEIDSKRVFVLGHSLGGMMIPQIAEDGPKTAGFISLAGATRPLEDMVIEQYTYFFELDGRITDKEKEDLDKLKDLANRIKTLTEVDIETNRQAILGAFPEYYLDLKDYNPAERAKSIDRPFLILQGGRDYQVTELDLMNWKTALDGKTNVSFKLYPDLNHLFISGKGKITPAEYQKAGHVSKEVIEDIAGFILNK